MSSSETSRPSALKKPSPTAASAGKYEFEIISGTAIFMGSSLFPPPRSAAEEEGILLLSVEQPAELLFRLLRDFRARRVARRKFFAPVPRLAGVDQRYRVRKVAGGAALRRDRRVGAGIP